MLGRSCACRRHSVGSAHAAGGTLLRKRDLVRAPAEQGRLPVFAGHDATGRTVITANSASSTLAQALPGDRPHLPSTGPTARGDLADERMPRETVAWLPTRSCRGDEAIAEAQLAEEESVPVCCLADGLVE